MHLCGKLEPQRLGVPQAERREVRSAKQSSMEGSARHTPSVTKTFWSVRTLG